MSATQQSGGGVGIAANGFPARSVLYRIALGGGLLSGLLLGSVAHAGTLYRCSGAAGEVVYSNSRSGYTGCHAVGAYGGARSHHAARPVGVTVKKQPPASLNGVSSSVQSTATRLGPVAPAGAMPASFSAVSASVETTATLLPAKAADRRSPGQWIYSESHSTATASAVAVTVTTAARDDQVLRGAVFRVTRADGSVEYTNVRPLGRGNAVVKQLFTYLATCMACNLHSPIHWGSVRLNLNAYADSIRAASVQFGVDEAFLRAIIHAESAFNPRALSLKGAQGLMQLMPGTAGDMGVADAFNPDQNIRGGARYLAQLLHAFNGDKKLAAAAYNAGPGAVQRYHGVPPYAETQVYVQRVSALLGRYSQAIHLPIASTANVPAAR